MRKRKPAFMLLARNSKAAAAVCHQIIFVGMLIIVAAQIGCGGQGTTTTTDPLRTPTAKVGWYNGDPQSGVPGQANWYVSDQQFSRTYDDFVVPSGGWTATGVFSVNAFMGFSNVTEAAWEIRSGVSTENGGTVIASGRTPATQTLVQIWPDGEVLYRIEVRGLQVQLPPGTYWLNVSPVVAQWSPGASSAPSYVSATLGANAIGNPPGNDRNAFFYSSVMAAAFFQPVWNTGQAGSSGDMSQGVLLAQ